MIFRTVSGVATTTGRAPLQGRATVVDGVPWLAGTLTAGDAVAWWPGPGVVQRPEITVLSDGEPVALEPLALVVSNAVESIPSATLEYAGGYPFGLPSAQLGTPGCDREITITGRYLGVGGEELYQTVLLGNARVVTGARRQDRAGGLQLTYSAAAGDQKNKPVTYQLPSRSGKRRDTVIREIAAAAGYNAQVSCSGVCNKRVDLDQAGWLDVVEEMAKTGGAILHWDEAGILRSYPATISADEVVTYGMGPEQILSGGASVENVAEPIKGIRATAEGVPDDACGAETKTDTRETKVFRSRRVALWKQETNGAINATGRTVPDPELLVETRIVTETETRCGTEIRRKETVFGWKLVERSRYVLDDDGAPDPGPPQIAGFKFGYFFGDAAPNFEGSEPLYLYDTERWVILSETWTIGIFDEDGWRVGEEIYSKGWRLAEGAIKESATATREWDTVGLIPLLEVTGQGKGCAFENGQVETYTQGAAAPPFSNAERDLLARQSTEYVLLKINGGAYISAEVKKTYGFRRLAGALAFYADGFLGLQDAETFGQLGQETTFYIAQGESAHVARTVRTDYSTLELGKPGNPAEETAPGTGYLPAATRLAEKVPGAAETGEPLEALVLLDSPCAGDEVVPIHYDWAETQAELVARARLDLDEAFAEYPDLETATLAAKVGDLVFLDLERLDVRRRARLVEVEHRGGRDGVTTRMRLRYSHTGDSA